MNDVAQGAEKAGGAFEKFGKEASKLANTVGQQKIRLAKLKDQYADLYLTLGAGDEKTQKVAEQITELSGNLDTNQKALQEAQAAADSFDATMQDIPGTMDQAGQSSQQFGSVLDDLIPKFTKAQLIKQAAIAILDFGKESVNMAASAESSFAKVKTLLSGGTDMAAYFDDIKQAAIDTGVSIEDYAEATYSAISASVDQGSAVEFTHNAIKLAKGGFTDAATAVDVLTTAINAYGLDASAATSISDKLITTQNLGKTTVGELASAMGKVIPTARSFNVNLDALCGTYAVMTKNGIATAESTTYLNGMLNELGKNGSVASTVLKEKTGQSFSDLMASGKSLGDVLTILQNEADRTGITLGDMFSSQEAAKAANTLYANLDDLAASTAAMGDSAGATQAAYTTMADTIAEKTTKLNNRFSILKESVGEELAPAFGTLLGSVEKCMPVIEALVTTLGSVVGGALSGVAFVVDSVATGISNVAEPSKQLTDTVDSQTQTLEEAHDAVIRLGTALGDAKKEFDASKKSYAESGQAMANTTPEIEQLQVQYDAAMAKYQEFYQAQQEAAAAAAEPANVMQAATEQYTTAATALLEQYQATYEATLSNVEGWFGPFDQAGSKVSTTLQQITDNMQSQIDFNTQYADNLQYLADNGLGSLGDALQSYGADGSAYAAAIVEQLQAVGGATSEEGQAIIENLTGLMDGMAESQSAVAENFTDMGGKFAEQMQTISTQYAETIQGLDKSGEAMEAATSTISSFISGLDSSKGGIMDTMGNIGSEMTSALQAALGDVQINVTASLTMSGGGRAIGLDYVPYNGMPAILHRGEAILNAPEAEDWRRGRGRGNGQGITIVQNIQSVPQTPIQLAAATQAMFEQARWAL